MASVFTCKDWSLETLLETSSNFLLPPRVSASCPQTTIEAAIGDYEATGIPLVIEDLHNHPSWAKDLLNVEWMRRCWRDEHGKSVQGVSEAYIHIYVPFQTAFESLEIPVRNVYTRTDKQMPLEDFIERAREAPFARSEGIVCTPLTPQTLTQQALQEQSVSMVKTSSAQKNSMSGCMRRALYPLNSFLISPTTYYATCPRVYVLIRRSYEST